VGRFFIKKNNNKGKIGIKDKSYKLVKKVSHQTPPIL
jgi:hypothetical protein